ncbi:hypothetical protein GCM10010185_42230 [Saccharothrix coeruleofusca]|uniref:DDE family transposase n=1 Tax=Saccharothrix coeruleofusca TaxID=33919 RepID=A0A918EG10_9PSEU|nr:hypothetical protein GCM10010185_42230 [Saccharothrix coeruleofusca]
MARFFRIPHWCRTRKGSAGGRPPAFGGQARGQRNVVERCFNRLEQFRAVATRFGKRWKTRWKSALNASEIAFDGRLAAGRGRPSSPRVAPLVRQSRSSGRQAVLMPALRRVGLRQSSRHLNRSLLITPAVFECLRGRSGGGYAACCSRGVRRGGTQLAHVDGVFRGGRCWGVPVRERGGNR